MSPTYANYSSSSLEDRLREILASRPEILFAFLFGSFARGRANNLSDVDVALYVDQDRMPPSGPYGYTSDLIVELRRQLKREVDVIILNEAPLILRFHVLQEGKLLFCREPAVRIHFHEKTVRTFLDFQPLLRIQAQCLRRRLESGLFGGGRGG